MKWIASFSPVGIADTEVVDALPSEGIVGAYIIYQNKVWVWCGELWHVLFDEKHLAAAAELVPHADKIAKLLHRAT